MIVAMHSSMLILWAILSLFVQSTSAGVFHQLYSSISTAGRTHGCVGELLTFTCTTRGTWMKWILQVGNRTKLELDLFVHFDHINRVVTDSSHEDITAILLDIQKINNTSKETKFTSVMFTTLSNNTLSGNINITCSSNTDNITRQYGIAETPQPPNLTTIKHLPTINPDTTDSVLYHIQWIPPKNVKVFDLDHYELIVGNLTMNIDTKENESIILLTAKKEITASIMAVDKCGKKSDSNSMALPILPSESESGNDIMQYHECSSCNTKIISSIIATFLVTLVVVAVVSMLIIWKTYKSPKHSCSSGQTRQSKRSAQSHMNQGAPSMTRLVVNDNETTSGSKFNNNHYWNMNS